MDVCKECRYCVVEDDDVLYQYAKCSRDSPKRAIDPVTGNGEPGTPNYCQILRSPLYGGGDWCGDFEAKPPEPAKAPSFWRRVLNRLQGK